MAKFKNLQQDVNEALNAYKVDIPETLKWSVNAIASEMHMLTRTFKHVPKVTLWKVYWGIVEMKNECTIQAPPSTDDVCLVEVTKDELRAMRDSNPNDEMAGFAPIDEY